MHVEPLADLVLKHYGGRTDTFLNAAARLHDDLDALEAEKLQGPRLQYHRLRSRWSRERCDELERMMDAMDIPSLERSMINNSFIYHDHETVYAVPTVLPASLGAVGLASGVAGAAYVGFSAISVGAAVLGALGVTAFVSANDATLNENPFGKLGTNLLSKASHYLAARTRERAERVVQKLRASKT